MIGMQLSYSAIEARLARWTFAGLLALAFFGCGRKAPPKPPQDVVPKTITDLSAASEAEGIRLSWSRPETYANGTRMNDLGGFWLERATPSEPSFSRLETLEVSDRERFRQLKRFQHLDRSAQPGITYMYRVVSFTTDRYVSEPSNVVSVVGSNPGEETHAPLQRP